MNNNLNGKKVLVLVSNGVDEGVMSTVQRDLLKSGATLRTIGTEPGLVNSWNQKAWGLYFPVDQQISQTLGADFDFLIVPSGERSIQKLAANPHAERIVSSFISAGKPVSFMGDAEVLLDKIGAEAAKEDPCVLTGDCTDVSAFVEKMIEHFTNVEAELALALAA